MTEHEQTHSVTPDDIESNIAVEYFFTAEAGMRGTHLSATCECSPTSCDPDHPTLSMVTFCVLVLKSGTPVTGSAACVNPEDFDAEAGKQAARVNAVTKLRSLMGFALKEKLSEELPQ